METSLRFDSRTKHLCLFAKEKFSNDDNYVLTVRVPRAPSRRERPNPNPRAREAAMALAATTSPGREVSPSDTSSPRERIPFVESRSSRLQTRDACDAFVFSID